MKLLPKHIKVVQYSILTEIPIIELRKNLVWPNTDSGVFDFPEFLATRKINQENRSNLVKSLRSKQKRAKGRSGWAILPENYSPNDDFDCRTDTGGIAHRFPPLTIEQYQSQFREPVQESNEPMPTFRSSHLPSSAIARPNDFVSSTALSTEVTETNIVHGAEGEVGRMAFNQRFGTVFCDYVVELRLDDNGNAHHDLPGGGAIDCFLDSNVFTIEGVKRSAMLVSYVSPNTVDLGLSITTPAFVLSHDTIVIPITNGVSHGIYDHLIQELTHHTDRLGMDLSNGIDAINAWKVNAQSRGFKTRFVAIKFREIVCPFELGSDLQSRLIREIHESGLTPASAHTLLTVPNTLDEGRSVNLSHMM